MLLELSAGPKHSVKLRLCSSTLFLKGLNWLRVGETWQRMEIMNSSTFAAPSFIR